MGYFFLIASLIFITMQVVIGLWFWYLFPAIGWKIPGVCLPVCLTGFVFFAMYYTRTHFGPLESVLYYAGYIWAGLVFIFFSIILALAVLQGLCALLHLPAHTFLKWTTLVMLTGAGVLSFWGGFSVPAVRHIHVQIPGAPHLTAVLISDSHLGEGVSLKRWKETLTRMQQQQPDMVLVLGDLFEYGPNRTAYAQALADFKTPLGTYGVLGNHEYYVGYQNSVDFYRQAGITLLENEITTLPNGMQIIGINDIQTAPVSAIQLDKLLAQTDPQKTRLLLSHQPLLTQTAAQHKIPLMLSGHTHAGQIFPFNLLVKLFYPYVHGLYKVGTHTQIYVTSGLFYWGMPLRLFAQAEIPVLHIN